MQTLIGTGVAVVTPFALDKGVDYPALRKVIQHLIKGGVEYLVVMGTTGESATLSHDEKRKVLDTFFEESTGETPIVMGIGGNDTRKIADMVDQYTRAYPQLGGILSVSPYYNKPSQEGLFQHYKAIAEATDFPIILYNVPGRTSSNVEAQTTLQLAHEVHNIVAVKEASGDLEQVMEIVRQKPEDFLLLSGDDALSLPILSLGGRGVISVSANAFPFEFSEMVRAALRNDWVKARELHYHLFPMMKLHFEEGNPAGVKMAMALQGLCEAELRLPLVKASNRLKEKIEAHLSRFQLN